jgi:transposase
MLIDMYVAFHDASLQGTRVIQVDECVFTFSTFKNKSWSHVYDNIEVVDKKITIKAQALIAGISEDKGLETYLITQRSIKTPDYLEFLQLIADLYPDQRVVLLLDNLSVHKTTDARAAYARHGMVPVFNVPYSPQFNGIEFYWSLVKAHYKRLLLYHLMHNLKVDCVDLIKSAMKRVSDEKAIKCAVEGRKNVEK